MVDMIQEQTRTKLPTLEEYFSAGGEFGAEVVDGEIILMSPNKRNHTKSSRTLFRSLDRHVEEKSVGEVWFETSFVLDGNKRENWVRGARTPDVAYITKEKFDQHEAVYVEDDPWWLAPDIAAEVVSPTDNYSDVMKKISDYLNYGVQLVWIIDPQTQTVRVHNPEKPDGYTLKAGEALTGAPVLPEWSISIAELFNIQQD